MSRLDHFTTVKLDVAQIDSPEHISKVYSKDIEQLLPGLVNLTGRVPYQTLIRKLTSRCTLTERNDDPIVSH